MPTKPTLEEILKKNKVQAHKLANAAVPLVEDPGYLDPSSEGVRRIVELQEKKIIAGLDMSGNSAARERVIAKLVEEEEAFFGSRSQIGRRIEVLSTERLIFVCGGTRVGLGHN